MTTHELIEGLDAEAKKLDQLARVLTSGKSQVSQAGDLCREAAQAISTLTAEVEELRAVIEEQETWENPIHRVALRAGFILCREYMARFVERGGDANTATSIRANWIPALGADPGPPRKMAFDEVVTSENMEEGPWEAIKPDLCVEAACYALCAANSLGMEWQCATLTKGEGDKT